MVAIAELSAPTQVVGLWAPGSAILTLGHDDKSRDSVALWQISVDGRATGAWIEPQDQAFTNPKTASRLLRCIERRALTAADPAMIDDVLTQLTRVAELDDVRHHWWDTHVFSITEAFAEVVARRVSFEQTVAKTKESGRSVAALEWTRDLPADKLPSSLTELRGLASLGVPAGAPAIGEVLTIANVLRWIVELWRDTEQVKGRRRYILDEHGPAEPLPPSWQSAVSTASANRLTL